MKIRQKLTFLFMLVTLMAVLVVGGVYFYSFRKSLTEQTLNGLQSTLNSRLFHIRNAIELRKEQAEIISSTYLARQLRSDGPNDTSIILKIQQHIDFIFSRMQQKKGQEISTIEGNKSSIIDIGIRDRNGVIIANTNRNIIGHHPQEDYLTPPKENSSWFVGYVYDAFLRTYSMMVFAEIRDYRTNEYAGVVVFKMNNTTLRDICYEFEGLGQTGEILLTQQIHDTIQYIVPPRNAPHLSFITASTYTDAPSSDALNGKRGSGIRKGYHGKEVLAIWTPMNEFGWGAVLQIETAEVFAPINKVRNQGIILILLSLLLAFLASWIFAKNMSTPIQQLAAVFNNISRGKTTERIAIHSKDELGQLSKSANETISYLNTIIEHANKLGNGDYSSIITAKDQEDILGNAIQKMTENLKRYDEESRHTIWLQESISHINDSLRGDMSITQLAENTLSTLSNIVQAKAGAFYYFDAERQLLILSGAYAIEMTSLPPTLALGSGLAGQAGKDMRAMHICHIRHEYLKINSALGETNQVCIYALPLLYRNEIKGVIELASYLEFTKSHIELLQAISEVIAIAIATAESRKKIQDLLEESQAQTEELSAQQEELQMQTNRLMASEEELKMQQEEMIENNRQLEEKSYMLEQKAHELEQISRYKSEFLANMSHELRTPLNSIMLLSKLLGDNTDENLTGEQTEFARIIHNAGNNLLQLINDILDLAKIESGRVEIQLQPTSIQELCRSLDDTYIAMAQEKNILYRCSADTTLPDVLLTDGLRIEQILKNLISNALKFTEKGSVEVHVSTISEEEAFASGFAHIPMIQFAVKDTGIGIAADKHAMVFDAFQQADGSTRRKYGGTGLGLSISRQLAKLLGGDITLTSEPGVGSVFSLFVPIDSSPFANIDQRVITTTTHRNEPTQHDITPKKHRRILLVEDNEHHALALERFLSGEKISCIIAPDATALFESLKTQEVDCIILDMGLPDSNGFDVLEKLKSASSSADIPVIIYTGRSLSAHEEKQLKKHAEAIVIKTTNSYQRMKEELHMLFSLPPTDYAPTKSIPNDASLADYTILLVDDDVRNIYAITKLLETQKIRVITALNGKEVLKMLKEHEETDLVLMDMMMPEMDGYTAIREIRKQSQWNSLPIIALTAKAMMGDRDKCLEAGASDYVTKPVDVVQLISLIRIWLFKK